VAADPAAPAPVVPPRGAIGALYLVVLIDLIGFGMIIPVFPFFATRIGVDPATVILLLGLYSIGQLVGAPLWGGLSDRIGRRPVLLATLVANTLATLLLGFADTALLLGLSRLVSGLAAGNISTAFAYATDISDDRTRPKYLGLLGSAFGLGFIIGPAIGGFLAGSGEDIGGFARVAFTAAGLSFAAFLCTALLVKESLPPEARQAGVDRLSWLGIVRIPAMRIPLWAAFTVIASTAILLSTFALWADVTLGVDPRGLGTYYAYIGALSAMIQGGGIGWLTRRLGEWRLAIGGAVSVALSLATLPLATGGGPLLLSLTLLGLGSACFLPSVSGLVAMAAPPTQRGAALGAYQSVASLGRTLGPFLASGVARVAGLSVPFFVGAVVAATGAILLYRARRSIRLRGPRPR
jgi:DHA1 family tetracycline resistance protein-like MFS transporter